MRIIMEYMCTNSQKTDIHYHKKQFIPFGIFTLCPDQNQPGTERYKNIDGLASDASTALNQKVLPVTENSPPTTPPT